MTALGIALTLQSQINALRMFRAILEPRATSYPAAQGSLAGVNSSVSITRGTEGHGGHGLGLDQIVLMVLSNLNDSVISQPSRAAIGRNRTPRDIHPTSAGSGSFPDPLQHELCAMSNTCNLLGSLSLGMLCS